MLICLEKAVNRINIKFRHGRDVLKAWHYLRYRKLTSEWVRGVAFPIEQECDVVVRRFVLFEDVGKHRVASVTIHFLSDLTAFVGSKAEESVVALLVDI